MGKITAILAKIKGQAVYIDTNLFIYFLNQNADFFAAAENILLAAEAGNFIAYTGDITVAETLVKPYQTDNIALVTDIKVFFYADNFLIVQSHDAHTFELCAQIRAKNGLKFADALHYATALKAGCQFFITNDAGIKSNEGMEVLLIRDFSNG